jgi:hypothetical protein
VICGVDTDYDRYVNTMGPLRASFTKIHNQFTLT